MEKTIISGVGNNNITITINIHININITINIKININFMGLICVGPGRVSFVLGPGGSHQ